MSTCLRNCKVPPIIVWPRYFAHSVKIPDLHENSQIYVYIGILLYTLVHSEMLYMCECDITIDPDGTLFFIRKVCMFFLFLYKSIFCGYSLEAPR